MVKIKKKACKACGADTPHLGNSCLDCRDRDVLDDIKNMEKEKMERAIHRLYSNENVKMNKDLAGKVEAWLNESKIEHIIENLAILKKTGSWVGGNLYMWGSAGTGKTTLASYIVLRFILAKKLTNELIFCSSLEWRGGVLESIRSTDIVVLDDIEDFVRIEYVNGVKTFSKQDQLALKNFITFRQTRGLPIIFTGNRFDEDVLNDVLSPPVYSRMMQNLTPIMMISDDRRLTKNS